MGFDELDIGAVAVELDKDLFGADSFADGIGIGREGLGNHTPAVCPGEHRHMGVRRFGKGCFAETGPRIELR